MDSINVRGTVFQKSITYLDQGSFALTGLFGQVRGGGAICAEVRNEHGAHYWLTPEGQLPPGPIVDQWREAM
jgi:hypothetical protein